VSLIYIVSRIGAGLLFGVQDVVVNRNGNISTATIKKEIVFFIDQLILFKGKNVLLKTKKYKKYLF
jgi:hypothetical protein